MNTIVFCIPVEGYCRTVFTKGTIQNVPWSNREQVSTKTSITYSIPKGDLYGKIRIDYGSKPGALAMINSIDKKQPYGLLYVEKPIYVMQHGLEHLLEHQMEHKLRRLTMCMLEHVMLHPILLV